jgi:exopolysaccharide biosynthesis polyprenyl glycosylphosphotransferase
VELADQQLPADRPKATPAPKGALRPGRERLSAVAPAPEAPETPEPPNVVVDVDVDVHPLQELRPVPPAARVRRQPLEELPVYDPFSARRRRTPEWLVTHTAAVFVVDVLAALVGLLATIQLPVTGSVPGRLFSVSAVVLWPALLALLGTYAERRQGAGLEEYRRVLDSGLIALAGLGVGAALVPGAGLGRLLLVGVPVGTVGTLLGRSLNRRRLHRARAAGRMTKRVVVVGTESGVLDLVRRMQRDRVAGLRVVAACLCWPGVSLRVPEEGVPVLGGLDDVLRVVDQARADAVLVAAATETSGHYLRDLAWRLEGTNIELLLGPGVIEVAPNRLQVRPTSSMPLIRIQEPEFRGVHRFLKALVDRCTAAVLVLFLAPLFLVLAFAIRLEDHGPVIYRQRRIGKQGREFDLLKFRSMVPDAEQAELLLHALNEGNEVQFKLRRDPRVTRVGRVLRRYSLDELPQLFNVLKGDMSLVGPRPHVTREVLLYGPDMHRRLLVKPGITGLWQVSGRSNLSWDESVELDVRYVENWSLTLDLSILWRTLRAVVRSSGAY